MRKSFSFKVDDVQVFKAKLLVWSQQFYEVVWLDSNSHNNQYSSFDGMLAVDALTALSTDSFNAFDDLKTYQTETKDWIFGYLTYDLKNNVERLKSENFDGLHFPELYFFQPKKIIQIQGDTAHFLYLNMVDDEIKIDFDEITNITLKNKKETKEKNIHIKMRIFKDDYFDRVGKMLQKIHRGDIYEANFCQEFYAEDTEINPLETYNELNKISKAPFSVFLKLNDKYVASASPERYIKKEGTTVISQPIKGTAKRSLDKLEDEKLRTNLALDEKERAENVMIVDLVRNDLSKSAIKGSVQVTELCKVYTYNQVHQMTSTITSTVKSDRNVVDIIKETFPMGSMTGAPKVSAMKIIEELEATKRGVYSGTVGYITPEQDFDFNVIIRSILYNATEKYVSFSVGGAITAKASPEKEYEECLLKAKAMRQVLEGKVS
ncbi:MULTISPECIES: anthranilate synthase component I family protein [unclassified Cellulophaga]|uniref:anthranilate synthase component I family protein n=1 Tax=unclassified Cellulophaga TaxID=2634405 RepID=UPI0026E17B34|nr:MULTISPECIES: chorismate-binding protein [unclassified Cellulophaga]MDO6491047.1 chorismate-binding protein [Cellulophaga sp. 2_MG-2023]MDO6493759.1 chorismate-binding protein [Cellulophaga sp. 3_MG-2023]